MTYLSAYEQPRARPDRNPAEGDGVHISVSGPDDPSHLIDALRGDLDSGFTSLYDAYRTPVFTTALRATGSWSDAEDLTAETFLRAYRSLISPTPPSLDTLRPRA